MLQLQLDGWASLGLHTVRSIMPVFWVAIILLFWTVWGSIPGTRLLGGSCAECGSEKYRSSIFDISARVVSAVGQKKGTTAVGFEPGSHTVRNGDLNV